MAENPVKEIHRSNKRAQRNPVQVSTLFSLSYVYYSGVLGLNNNIKIKLDKLNNFINVSRF